MKYQWHIVYLDGCSGQRSGMRTNNLERARGRIAANNGKVLQETNLFAAERDRAAAEQALSGFDRESEMGGW